MTAAAKKRPPAPEADPVRDIHVNALRSALASIRRDGNAPAMAVRQAEEALADLLAHDASRRTEVVPPALLDRTFALQHAPNCVSPFLVRLPGKGGVVDMKFYGNKLFGIPNESTDILGFGKTFAQAADAVFAAEVERKAK